jgi:metal-responsive CopG/Arc/MetJ family transcriptional regulator
MSTLSFQLPDDIVQEFEQLVSAEKQSRENVFIKAMKLYMYQKNARKIRRSLRPYSKKAGIMTEEDLFEQLT